MAIVARFRPIVSAAEALALVILAVLVMTGVACGRHSVLNIAGRHPIRAPAARAVRHADDRIVENRAVGGGPPIRARVEIGRHKQRRVRDCVRRSRRRRGG